MMFLMMTNKYIHTPTIAVLWKRIKSKPVTIWLFIYVRINYINIDFLRSDHGLTQGFVFLRVLDCRKWSFLGVNVEQILIFKPKIFYSRILISCSKDYVFERKPPLY